jgi:hypothetical protein
MGIRQNSSRNRIVEHLHIIDCMGQGLLDKEGFFYIAWPGENHR